MMLTELSVFVFIGDLLSLDDFIPVGDKFLTYKYEQERFFVYCFVRGTRNATKYEELYWSSILHFHHKHGTSKVFQFHN